MESEWRTARFSELCDIKRGASPRPIQDWIATTGIPWIKISDANASGGRFIYDTTECIKESGRSKSVTVYPGDLILSNSATPGIPKFIGIEACIHDGWLLLREFRGLDKNFAYYLLLTQREALIGQGNGSVFTNLKTEILKNHEVKIPPLAEQRAIAHILGTLDDKIELLRRQNETLEAMARALFKSWFVDFDPVRAKMEGRWRRGKSLPGLHAHLYDLFPERLVESELGEIPEGWAVTSVDVEFDVTMGQSPPGNTYNETGEGLPFYQGRADFEFRFPKRRVYCTAPTRLAKNGDTLVSVRAPVGDINMASEDCAIGRGVAAVRHKTGCRSYTYQFMSSISDVFARFDAEGTVFGSIGKKDFHSIAHVKPPRDLVLAYEKLAAQPDDQIERSERESRTLAQLRDNLLPKLISGKLRVGEAESLIEEAIA